jgi:hypothetical protein
LLAFVLDDANFTEEKAKDKYILNRLAWLPGGFLFFALIETTAQGMAVAQEVI